MERGKVKPVVFKKYSLSDLYWKNHNQKVVEKLG